MRWNRNNIRDVKKALAATYPDIEFRYGTEGHGYRRGHAVRWTGGPNEEAVRAVIDEFGVVKHFCREMTPAEFDIWWAATEAASAAWKAEAPARRAAGVAKRKATVARKRARVALLAEAFPSVAFAVSHEWVEWTDGPDEAAVAALLGPVWCRRTVSPEAKEQAKWAKRIARRLDARRMRDRCIAEGVMRRLRGQYATHRLTDARQFCLPLAA